MIAMANFNHTVDSRFTTCTMLSVIALSNLACLSLLNQKPTIAGQMVGMRGSADHPYARWIR